MVLDYRPKLPPKHFLLKIHNNSTFAELLFSVKLKVDFLIISYKSYKWSECIKKGWVDIGTIVKFLELWEFAHDDDG